MYIFINIFRKIIKDQKDSYNKQLLTLKEQKNILEINNKIIKEEYEDFRIKLNRSARSKIVAI
jgi:hypothetical protein